MPKKKKPVKRTYVALVLDCSGSMSKIHNETVEGINSQLRSIREGGEKGGITEVSLIQFDDHDNIKISFDGVAADKVKPFKVSDFKPEGWTAMHDGIWKAIQLLKKKEETEDTGYLVCVISDGDENDSKEMTEETIGLEVQKLQATGKWTFTYLLANTDIKKVAKRLHVPANNIASFVSDSLRSSAAYTVNASSIGGYLDERSVGATAVNAFYSNGAKVSLDK